MSDKGKMLDGNRNNHSPNDSPLQNISKRISVNDPIQQIREHENDLKQKRGEQRNKNRPIESDILRFFFQSNQLSRQGTVDTDMECMAAIIQCLESSSRPSTDSIPKLDTVPSTGPPINPISESSFDSPTNSDPIASTIQAVNLNSGPSPVSTTNSDPVTSTVQATNLYSERSPVSTGTSLTASKIPKGLSMETKKYQEEIATQANQLRQYYEKVRKERQVILRAYTRHVLNVLRPDTRDSLIKDLSAFFSGAEKKIANQCIKIENDEERLVALSSLAKGVCDQLLGSDMNETKASVFLPFIQQISKLPNQPEFRVIFLDFLYKTCPYTVPSYPEYSPNATETEKLKAIGYVEKREGDIIRLENEIEFLNRMTGLIRLYCKLLACGEPPIGTDRRVAWRWMADLLNMEPVENMSAILVRVFLCEVGNTMRQYNRNFGGLIALIKSQFIEKLKLVTNNHEMELLRQTLESW